MTQAVRILWEQKWSAATVLEPKAPPDNVGLTDEGGVLVQTWTEPTQPAP